MTENLEDMRTSSCKRISEGSIGSRFWNFVLEGTQRDILTDISYAQDKMSLVRRHRQIELDPNFWVLDDEIVNLLKTGSPEEIKDEIERMEESISNYKTQLAKANKMTRYMYSNQAVFHSAIEAFERHIPIPNTLEPTERIQELAESLTSLLLQLEETMMKNVELEMKLASLDDHFHALQGRMKEVKVSKELTNVQPRLEAVELQSCMLNELLNRIIADMQDTSKGMKTLESGEEHDVRTAIREGLILSFGALDDCFQNLIAPRNALSQYLWVPHDASLEGYKLDELLGHLRSSDEGLIMNMIQGLKHLKRAVKDLNETHEKVQEVKRKVLWADERKRANRQATILWFSIPKRYEHSDRQSIQSAIAREALQ